MSLDINNLQTRAATLNANLKHTLQLIQQLSRIQPGDAVSGADTTPQDDDNETRNDLTASIHEQLKSSEDDLELLHQDVADADHAQAYANNGRRNTTAARTGDSQRELARCLGQCEKLEEDLKLTRTRFRRAQLTAKANAERSIQRERASYLSSLQAAAAASVANTSTQRQSDNDTSKVQDQKPKYTDLFAGRRPKPSPSPTSTVQDDILLTTSSDVTSSLRRTHNLLQSELSRSQFAHETLASSNEALKELNQRYDSFDDLISKSRGLLGTLLRSQKSDTWYLETTCWLLICVIVWLVFRRWIYGPFWWFFWMPVKLIFNLLWGMRSVLGISGRGKGTQSTAMDGTTVIGSATGHPSATMSAQSQTRSTDVSQNTGDNARSPPGSLSETVGRMIESSSSAAPSAMQQDSGRDGNEGQDQQPPAQDQDERSQEVRRGDGQPLPQRDEVTQPRNPKKRMMEEPDNEPSQDEERQRPKDEL